MLYFKEKQSSLRYAATANNQWKMVKVLLNVGVLDTKCILIDAFVARILCYNVTQSIIKTNYLILNTMYSYIIV